jgi:polyisoprenoid-binding protein YceI
MQSKWALALILAAASGQGVLAADSYTIDPNHTYPSLEFSHMGLSVWRGKFNKSSGSVRLDRAARTGSAEIAIEIASIDFGHEKMNEFALTPDWLDAARFPTMTYKGMLRFNGDTPATVDGQLTLRGVTRPVKLKINSFKCIMHPYYKKEVCGADAEGDLDRAEFGMTQYTEDNAGKIHLHIQVEAIKDS